MLEQTNDTMINKAVFVLREMSADERMREMARQREKILHDEASYMLTARHEGEKIGEKRGVDKLLAQLRSLGADEAMLSQAVSNLQE